MWKPKVRQHIRYNEALPELLGLQKLIGIRSHGTEQLLIQKQVVKDLHSIRGWCTTPP